MKNKYHALIFFSLITSTIYSQTTDDNVVINRCEDNYIFKEENGNTTVENTRKAEYETIRMGASIQPYVYYGEFLSIDGAKMKGIFAPKPIYKNATPDNVFFDDTRICYFDIDLPRQGKKAEVEFNRTYHDLRYFTCIYFPENYFTREKRIVITIPRSLSCYRLAEKNFTPDIQCEKSVNKQGDSLFIYTLKDMPTMKDETSAPSSSYLYPHLLVTGYFAGTQQMYQWLNGLANVDCSLGPFATLPTEITKGCSTDMDKIRRIYAYVQQHIRYVAFENGIAGHQPDRPSEVIRKRYGDCKGMSLLLCTLLKAEGFDARMGYTGTESIAYSPNEIPTLSTINHAICILFHQGKMYCLDATNRYLSLEDIPEGVQGRKVLVENGADCRIETLPLPKEPSATDSLCYRYELSVEGAAFALKGTVSRQCTGMNKELLLNLYDSKSKEGQNNFLLTLLTDRLHNRNVTDIRMEGNTSEVPYWRLSGTITNIAAVQSVEGELFIEPDPHYDFFDQPIDTTKRKQDYILPYRCRNVREVSIKLPAKRTVSYLPSNFSIETPQGKLSCSFRIENNHILFHKEMEITKKRIPLALIPQWNQALKQWKKASEEQIVIH